MQEKTAWRYCVLLDSRGLFGSGYLFSLPRTSGFNIGCNLKQYLICIWNLHSLQNNCVNNNLKELLQYLENK